MGTLGNNGNEAKNGSYEKAMRFYEAAMDRDCLWKRMMNGTFFIEEMQKAAYFLEKAGRLDVIQYDFSDPKTVHIIKSKNCSINDSDGLIYENHPIHGNSYVCRFDDLYILSDSMRVFIIDFNQNSIKDIEFIAELTWRWLDTYLGYAWNVDRKHVWNAPKENIVPSYVVHTAKSMFYHPAHHIPQLQDMSAAWRLVNHKSAKNALRRKYDTINLLDAEIPAEAHAVAALASLIG